MKAGQIVKSVAGRDKNSFYVVMQAAGAEAYIADGKLRKLSKPKRKNVKHIKATDCTVDLNGKTDKWLRNFLRDFSEPCLKSQGR